MKVFDDLFVQTTITAEPIIMAQPADVIAAFEDHLPNGFRGRPTFLVRFQYQGFRGEAQTPFGVQTTVCVDFGDFDYTWHIDSETPLRKLYSEPVLSDEISGFVESVQKQVFKTILDRKKQA